MAKAVEAIKKANPFFEHRLFDDHDCRELIKHNFPKQILEAYDCLIPGAYKADLWRYCVLYLYGGIYLDIKYTPVNNFSFEAFVTQEHFCSDRPEYFLNKKGVYNAFMILPPGNKVLKEAILTIHINCKYSKYFNSPLYPTGPGLLSEINPTTCRYIFRYENPDKVMLNEVVVLQAYSSYREWAKQYYMLNRKEHYLDAWKQKCVCLKKN